MQHLIMKVVGAYLLALLKKNSFHSTEDIKSILSSNSSLATILGFPTSYAFISIQFSILFEDTVLLQSHNIALFMLVM